MSDLGRFFKHSSIYAVGNIINRIGAFLLLPVYTNYLTVGEYGALELFYVVMSVVSGFLAMGMSHATLRFYFDYDELKDRHASISTNFIGALVITSSGVGILALFSDNLSLLVFEDEALEIGFYLIFATMIFEFSSQICLAYVRAIEYSIFFVVISLMKLILQVSINTYLVIYMEAGIVGVLFGNLCTVFLGWLILALFTLHRCGIIFEWKKFTPIIKYCLPFLPMAVMGVISENASRYFLSSLLSFEALGLFALALKFGMVLEQLIGEPFSRSYGAFRYTIMDKSNAAELQAKIVKYLLIVASFSALGIALLAEDLIHIMSDEKFWPAAALVPLIMISSVIRVLLYPAQTGILYEKKTKYLFYFSSVGSALALISSYMLISWIGIYGACFSLIFTESAVLYLTNAASQKYFDVNYDYKSLVLIILLTIFIYFLSRMYIPSTITFSIVFKFLLLGLFMYSIVKLGILNVDEMQSIKSFTAARIGTNKTARY